MARILLIDDEKKLAEAVGKELEAAGHTVECLNRAEPGLERLSAQRFDVVLLDNNIAGGGMTGLEFLTALGERGINTPVILMTGDSSTDTAIEAMRKGAFEYVIKAGTYREIARELLPHIEEAVKLTAIVAEVEVSDDEKRSRRRRAADAGLALISNKNRDMVKHVFRPIAQFADSRHPVLILGETGTGKELVARAFHTNSSRKTKPFVAVNCSNFGPDSLLDTELFGNEANAYTGAKFKKGKFEYADGGTLFLDELGDMPITIQAKLLRVVEYQKLTRIGGNEEVDVDVRLVSATNLNLEAMVAEGKFRVELLTRLNRVPVRLPPLRERLDDLPDLIDYFLDRAAQAAGRPCPAITCEALEKLQSHTWPQNVRELQNVIFSAFGRCRGSRILPSDIVFEHLKSDKPAACATSLVPTTEDEARDALRKVIAWAWATNPGNVGKQLNALLECELLRVAQAECNGIKTEMGRRVDMVPNTVRKMMKEYGLE